MIIAIPTGREYTATVRGRLPKLVTCEQCGMEYVYLLERSASGKASSLLWLDNRGAKERARSAACKALQRELERGVDVVPCPGCGHVPPDMVRQARTLHLRWLNVAALVFLPITAIMYVAGIVAYSGPGAAAGPAVWLTWSLIAAAALCVPGLPLLRYFLCRSYDPNDGDPETRKNLARQRAVSKETFFRAVQHSSQATRVPEDQADVAEAQEVLLSFLYDV